MCYLSYLKPLVIHKALIIYLRVVTVAMSSFQPSPGCTNTTVRVNGMRSLIKNFADGKVIEKLTAYGISGIAVG